MAIDQVAIGLNKQGKGDAGWDVGLDDGFDDANTRLTLNGAGAPSGVDGDWLGQKYYDTTNDETYYCTATGSPGTFKSLSGIVNDLTLTMTQVLTLSAILNANAGIVMPTGQTLEGFAGEAFIKDSGGDTMDPLGHAARHNPSSADDPISLGTLTFFDNTPATTSISAATETTLFDDTTGLTIPAGAAWDIEVHSIVNVHIGDFGVAVLRLYEDIDGLGYNLKMAAKFEVSGDTVAKMIAIPVFHHVSNAAAASVYKYRIRVEATAASTIDSSAIYVTSGSYLYAKAIAT